MIIFNDKLLSRMEKIKRKSINFFFPFVYLSVYGDSLQRKTDC